MGDSISFTSATEAHWSRRRRWEHFSLWVSMTMLLWIAWRGRTIRYERWTSVCCALADVNMLMRSSSVRLCALLKTWCIRSTFRRLCEGHTRYRIILGSMGTRWMSQRLKAVSRIRTTLLKRWVSFIRWIRDIRSCRPPLSRKGLQIIGWLSWSETQRERRRSQTTTRIRSSM